MQTAPHNTNAPTLAAAVRGIPSIVWWHRDGHPVFNNQNGDDLIMRKSVLALLDQHDAGHARVSPAARVDGLADMLTADELGALQRFQECADDGEGYDVPKEMMQRLAVIGVVRRRHGNVYEATEFGMRVLDDAPRHSDVSDVPAWRVGEFWSSSSPGKKVLMLASGARDIESFGKHESFIRWVGGPSLGDASPAWRAALEQARYALKEATGLHSCGFNEYHASTCPLGVDATGCTKADYVDAAEQIRTAISAARDMVREALQQPGVVPAGHGHPTCGNSHESPYATKPPKPALGLGERLIAAAGQAPADPLHAYSALARDDTTFELLHGDAVVGVIKFNDDPAVGIAEAALVEQAAMRLSFLEAAVRWMHAQMGGGPEPLSYQERIHLWMLACFGPEVAADASQRSFRFYEEATELVQSCGMSRADAHTLVNYVYDRPIGEKDQEVGGTMVTLAALCNAHGISLMGVAETELLRVWTIIDRIRAKQASKPNGSPLPGSVPAATHS